MDPVFQLGLQRLWLLPLLLIWGLSGCAAERLVAREVLADPMMRFKPGRPIAAPGEQELMLGGLLPTDTVEMRAQAMADPGQQVEGTWVQSSLRSAVELVAGLGLEIGYGMSLENETILKRDGYLGPIQFERLRHGPDGALVYDDGTSILRVGYAFRTAFDGDIHSPSLSARTLILGSDTVVELSYARTMAAIKLGQEELPAAGAVSSKRESDYLRAALEQGFLPGINLRLELAARLDNGFLQDPYRLVTLWCHRPTDGAYSFGAVPQTKAENHPDSRVRVGGMLRARFAIPAWTAALELNAGHGTGTWRVEHSQAGLAWLQRMGDRFSLALEGGAYHQTRASFYRDDYPEGPEGKFYSADRNLSSYIAWWSQLSLLVNLIPERGRLLAMFQYLNLEFGARALQADHNFEGLGSDNGFTSYPELSGQAVRETWDGGWQFGGWFALIAGF